MTTPLERALRELVAKWRKTAKISDMWFAWTTNNCADELEAALHAGHATPAPAERSDAVALLVHGVAEPLRYGVIESLEDARNAADDALREGLKGKYPAALVVLDMAYSRLASPTSRSSAQGEAK